MLAKRFTLQALKHDCGEGEASEAADRATGLGRGGGGAGGGTAARRSLDEL
jgi:hypothetical protein